MGSEPHDDLGTPLDPRTHDPNAKPIRWDNLKPITPEEREAVFRLSRCVMPESRVCVLSAEERAALAQAPDVRRTVVLPADGFLGSRPVHVPSKQDRMAIEILTRTCDEHRGVIAHVEAVVQQLREGTIGFAAALLEVDRITQVKR